MSKHIFTTKGTMLGTIAKYAVAQSPYHRPDNLEVVLDKMNELISKDFDSAPLKVMEFDSFSDLETYISVRLGDIPEFTAWNASKNPSDSEFYFVSAYDKEGDPDNDFIDLDALTRNVASEIENDQ